MTGNSPPATRQELIVEKIDGMTKAAAHLGVPEEPRNLKLSFNRAEWELISSALKATQAPSTAAMPSDDFAASLPLDWNHHPADATEGWEMLCRAGAKYRQLECKLAEAQESARIWEHRCHEEERNATQHYTDLMALKNAPSSIAPSRMEVIGVDLAVDVVRDAERYRWLQGELTRGDRSEGYCPPCLSRVTYPADMDRIIDDEIAAASTGSDIK